MASREVVKEFLGALMNKIAANRGRAAAKKILNSPETKKLAIKARNATNDLVNDLQKRASKGQPGAQQTLDLLKDLGLD